MFSTKAFVNRHATSVGEGGLLCLFLKNRRKVPLICKKGALILIEKKKCPIWEHVWVKFSPNFFTMRDRSSVFVHETHTEVPYNKKPLMSPKIPGCAAGELANCCRQLSAHCSLESKQKFAGNFPFISNNYWEMCNMRTGNEIVNPYILLIWDFQSKCWSIVTPWSFHSFTNSNCLHTISRSFYLVEFMASVHLSHG